MTEIRKIDARRIETDNLNESNVGPLRRLFSDGCYQVGRLRLIARKNIRIAEGRLASRRKVVLVDLSSAILLAAGHAKSSEGLRDAVVDADEEILKIKALISDIKIVDALLELQREVLEKAYFSCAQWERPRIGLPNNLLSHNVTAAADDPDPMPEWGGGPAKKPPAGGVRGNFG